jgi:hypothetical protein
MRWSKLKHLIEARFAPSIAKRLAVHSAAYGNCTCGHCWITLDGQVIANFCTRAYFNRKVAGVTGTNPMYSAHLVVYGELSRQDAYRRMFDFVHKLTVEEALGSGDALLQVLAVVDSRLGKRRLRALDKMNLHALAQTLLARRCNSEFGASGAA